jgi:hypothetical protein
MASNKYNRGMPIIQRHKPVELVSAELTELKVEPVHVTVIPINVRRHNPITRNPARVRAIRTKAHTFFWALAS